VLRPPLTEYEKQKIGISLAMLGGLLAIHAIVGGFGRRFVRIFGAAIQFRYLYAGVAVVLGFAVYCYALAFLPKSIWQAAKRVGDIFYGIALVAPPVLFVFWLISQVPAKTGPRGWLSNSQRGWLTNLLIILSVIPGVMNVLVLLRHRREPAKNKANRP
jgi:hypothetical protein